MGDEKANMANRPDFGPDQVLSAEQVSEVPGRILPV